MKYFVILFLALTSILSQASILSDGECRYSSRAHSAFEPEDRKNSNLCIDAIVTTTLKSCDAITSDSQAQQRRSSRGVRD